MSRRRRRVQRAQRLLRAIGWPIKPDGYRGPQTKEAIRYFKRGWAAKPRFRLVNASLGPVTMRRLTRSYRAGGKCSKHFRYSEFASKGNGWIKVAWQLVRGLERYRKFAGATNIVSGYRDPAHNAAVGGASKSQHKYGTAADLPPELHLSEVRDLRAFSGIGVQGDSGLVRHVDVRHTGPNNATGGTRRNPTVWFY